MKLGINEIREGIHEAAILKIERQLNREGFDVKRNYSIEDSNIEVDLFAYNNVEKRIYEFKIGHNKIQNKQFQLLQRYSRDIGAKLFIIYLEVPHSKRIAFNGIEDIIFGHMTEFPPVELLELATHVNITDIANIDINAMDVDDEIIHIRGSGSIFVDTQFGSPSDLYKNNGVEEHLEFEFWFRLKLNVAEKKILNSYYKIDTGWYYE